MKHCPICKEGNIRLETDFAHVAIAEKIKFLKELANDLDEIGSHQEAEDMRHSVDDLNDAYQKSIHFDEWKVEK